MANAAARKRHQGGTSHPGQAQRSERKKEIKLARWKADKKEAAELGITAAELRFKRRHKTQ